MKDFLLNTNQNGPRPFCNKNQSIQSVAEPVLFSKIVGNQAHL